MKDEMKGGLMEIFKDAPLPIRMLGRAITPIVSNLMSGLAETLAEQQEATQKIMKEAQRYVQNDANVVRLVGEPIQVGTPFSQSLSSTSINGKKASRVTLAFPVTGSMGSGVCRLVATDGIIEVLEMDAAGRRIAVGKSTSRGGTRPSFKKGSSEDDNIIEAEIIEKEVKR